MHVTSVSGRKRIPVRATQDYPPYQIIRYVAFRWRPLSPSSVSCPSRIVAHYLFHCERKRLEREACLLPGNPLRALCWTAGEYLDLHSQPVRKAKKKEKQICQSIGD